MTTLFGSSNRGPKQNGNDFLRNEALRQPGVNLKLSSEDRACMQFISMRFAFCVGELLAKSRIQSGSKTCHSTKPLPRMNFPKYVISIQVENSSELIFIAIGRCQLDDFWGTPPGLFWGVPQFSGAEISTNKSFELFFEIYHLTFNLKLF